LGINKEAISTHANFFELGGHSLKATKLASKIHKELNVRVPLAEIFNTQILLGLAEYIKNLKQDTFTSIEPAEKKEYYKLSSPQKRLYIMQQMEPESTSYNIFGMIPMAGDVKKDRLEMTFGELIKRHEGMRTSFEIVNQEPVQRPHDVVDFKVEYHNLTGDNDIHDSILKIQKAFLKPFDLTRCPLLRVGLVMAGEYNLLLVNMHHIISDGTSFEVLKGDSRAIYEGKELPGLRLQYKDYAEWQDSETHRLLLRKQEEFWLKQFEDGVPVLDILPDYPRAAACGHRRDHISFDIDEQLTAEIRKIEAEREVTTFIILLVLYYVLLAKYTDQPDIVVGTGIAGRTHQDLQKVIGLFVNMLPMRNRPAEFKTFLEFLDEVKQNALNAYENQDYQFDQLVSKLKVQREPGRNPMFDTQFTFLNMDQDVNTWELPAGIPSREQEVEKEAQFDLSLNGSEADDKIMMEFIYSASLFKRETIEEWAKHYVDILEQIIKNKHIKLDDIKISYDFVQAKTGLRQADMVNFNF
jgi:fengycin family lipopeptide synthetase D